MEGLSRQERVHFWVDNIWNGYFWGDREGKDQLEMTDHPFVAILPPMVEGERYYASRAGNNVDTQQLWLVSAKTEYLDNILRMIDWGSPTRASMPWPWAGKTTRTSETTRECASGRPRVCYRHQGVQPRHG